VKRGVLEMKKIQFALVLLQFLIIIYLLSSRSVITDSIYNAHIVKRYTGNHNGPAELIVENKSNTKNSMTEIRATADQCSMDLGAT
jgi:hypothetical protein